MGLPKGQDKCLARSSVRKVSQEAEMEVWEGETGKERDQYMNSRLS